MIIKHYNSRTAQTENNSELELVKIELELKNTKAIAQVKSASIALNTALFVNNIHQVLIRVRGIWIVKMYDRISDRIKYILGKSNSRRRIVGM